jgi:hypothetical protein
MAYGMTPYPVNPLAQLLEALSGGVQAYNQSRETAMQREAQQQALEAQKQQMEAYNRQTYQQEQDRAARGLEFLMNSGSFWQLPQDEQAKQMLGAGLPAPITGQTTSGPAPVAPQMPLSALSATQVQSQRALPPQPMQFRAVTAEEAKAYNLAPNLVGRPWGEVQPIQQMYRQGKADAREDVQFSSWQEDRNWLKAERERQTQLWTEQDAPLTSEEAQAYSLPQVLVGKPKREIPQLSELYARGKQLTWEEASQRFTQIQREWAVEDRSKAITDKEKAERKDAASSFIQLAVSLYGKDPNSMNKVIASPEWKNAISVMTGAAQPAIPVNLDPQTKLNMELAKNADARANAAAQAGGGERYIAVRGVQKKASEWDSLLRDYGEAMGLMQLAETPEGKRALAMPGSSLAASVAKARGLLSVYSPDFVAEVAQNMGVAPPTNTKTPSVLGAAFVATISQMPEAQRIKEIADNYTTLDETDLAYLKSKYPKAFAAAMKQGSAAPATAAPTKTSFVAPPPTKSATAIHTKQVEPSKPLHQVLGVKLPDGTGKERSSMIMVSLGAVKDKDMPGILKKAGIRTRQDILNQAKAFALDSNMLVARLGKFLQQ